MKNGKDVELRHLRAFEVLLRERNLTRAADSLGIAQPALSKTLAKLRRYFGDPLFVRSANRMEPTTKALELAGSVRMLLDGAVMLRAQHRPFDPALSDRQFTLSVVDAGLARLLPRLLAYLERHAPGVRLRIVPIELEGLEAALETGHIDFALGAFASLSKRVRRQPLWPIGYVSVVRRDHPRLIAKPSLQSFVAERHIVVSTAGTGHSQQRVERALERALPPNRIVCRVSTFLAAAFTVSRTDLVATLPDAMVAELDSQLGLRSFATPLRLPRMETALLWHERFHRDPGSEWLRAAFAKLFRSEP
ncbi:MAG TPA: LysR family transcriptional regulator [Gammaproteobacteria bacterium]|nr:LysR family transcriptional regulator [Gammaproteobacteria bacterium]